MIGLIPLTIGTMILINQVLTPINPFNMLFYSEAYMYVSLYAYGLIMVGIYKEIEI